MKLKFTFPILILLFVVSACNNDLDLTNEWEDIPIAYAKISLQDTAYFVRVEKAFLDPETDAFQLAQNSDSLYYENVIVELERVSDGSSILLERVDGNTQGFPRDSGIFATTPNYLYKGNATLLPLTGGDTVLLKINRGDNLPEVTAKTVVLPNMEFSRGRPPTSIFNWDKQKKVRVTWKPNSDDCVIFDMEIGFDYFEVHKDRPNEIVKKSFKFQVEKNRIRNTDNSGSEDIILSSEIPGDVFFQAVGSNIEVNSDITRAFDAISFTVIGGGTEIRDYIQLTLANQGITGSQEPPNFTNLSNGAGVFTSTSTSTVEGIGLGLDALDSLVLGRFTKDLNF